MATFHITTFPDVSNTEANIIAYKEGINGILQGLAKNLDSLPLAAEIQPLLATAQKVRLGNLYNAMDAIISAVENSTDTANIENYPRLWALTRRAGKSDIALENQPQKIPPAIYEAVKNDLETQLKTLSSFNATEREAKKHINATLNKLEQWQKDSTEAYVRQLRNTTANALIVTLNKFEKALEATALGDKRKTLIAKINEIKALTSNHVTTSTACLEYNKKANDLRNELLQFKQNVQEFHNKTSNPIDLSKFNESGDFNQLAEQLSVVTKRWLDPFYDDPKELTRFEKARLYLKMASVNIGAICALGALITFFVFPPAALPLGLISLVGLLPVANSIFEAVRHLYYGRTPTIAQTTELGIMLPLLSGLIFGIHAFPLIAGALVHSAPKVATALTNISVFLATKLMNAVGGALNTFFSLVTGAAIKKAKTPKLESHLATHKKVKLHTILQALRDKEEILDQKSKILRSLPQKDLQRGLIYTYKNKDNDYAYKSSHIEHIAKATDKMTNKWFVGHYGPVPSASANDIQTAVQNYCKLKTSESVDTRLKQVGIILNKITDWEKHVKDPKNLEDNNDPLKRSSNRWEAVQKLKELVTHEKTLLEGIHADLHDEEKTAYLTHYSPE